MSHAQNDIWFDNIREQLDALEEVLKPSMFEVVKNDTIRLINNGDFEGAESFLQRLQIEQEVLAI